MNQSNPWPPGENYLVPAAPINLTPSITLYNYDGPKLFTADVFGITMIVTLLEESDSEDLWLAAPISAEKTKAIRENRLSVYGGFHSETVFVIKSKPTRDLPIERLWIFNRDQIPDDLWPTRGCGLAVGYHDLPDHL